jgi:hypothetical protein
VSVVAHLDEAPMAIFESLKPEAKTKAHNKFTQYLHHYLSLQ